MGDFHPRQSSAVSHVYDRLWLGPKESLNSFLFPTQLISYYIPTQLIFYYIPTQLIDYSFPLLYSYSLTVRPQNH